MHGTVRAKICKTKLIGLYNLPIIVLCDVDGKWNNSGYFFISISILFTIIPYKKIEVKKCLLLFLIKREEVKKAF